MEQLFLVVKPRGEVKALAQKIRNRINENYHIYGRVQPAIHATVEVISLNKAGDLQAAKDIIAKISRQFSPFKLEITGFVFFPPPFKAITLAVNKNNEIEIISKLVYEALAEQGMAGREDLQSWKFHITVASPFGAERVWGDQEFRGACQMVANWSVAGSCLIDQLELWRPVFDPVKMREATFPLKKF
ncbi:MAG: 2'-5' RNA ligase family protein [Peptococcaceae bacterium]